MERCCTVHLYCFTPPSPLLQQVKLLDLEHQKHRQTEVRRKTGVVEDISIKQYSCILFLKTNKGLTNPGREHLPLFSSSLWSYWKKVEVIIEIPDQGLKTLWVVIFLFKKKKKKIGTLQFIQLLANTRLCLSFLVSYFYERWWMTTFWSLKWNFGRFHFSGSGQRSVFLPIWISECAIAYRSGC